MTNELAQPTPAPTRSDNPEAVQAELAKAGLNNNNEQENAVSQILERTTFKTTGLPILFGEGTDQSNRPRRRDGRSC